MRILSATILTLFTLVCLSSISYANEIYPEQELLNLINSHRQQIESLPPLYQDWEAARVARYKAEDMLQQNYFGHHSPVYGSFFDMLDNFNILYLSAGENIAANFPSPQSVMEAWLSCPEHRKNILSRNFTRAGVGYVPEGNYWVLILIEY